MKKMLVLSFLFSAVAFSALKDGTYTEVSTTTKGDTVYKSEVTVVVKGGKIVAFKAEDSNDKDFIKSKDEKYNAKWMSKSNTDYNKFLLDFSKELIEKQDPDKIDNIAGATHITKSYKELVKKALNKAK